MVKLCRGIRIVFVCALVGLASCALQAEGLPEAPRPQSHAPVPDRRSNASSAVSARRWSGVVNPGEKIPALTARDKLLFPLHEEFSWSTPIPLLYDAEYGVLTNADPKYGTNGKAWGERLGSAALRQAITRFFTDGVLPIAFHEDPRYYRLAHGGYRTRAFYALRRIYIAQSDSGHRTFNFSDVIGRGMGAALTQAYYPDRSRNAGVVIRTWGLSLVALGGANAFEEFWPDLKVRLFHSSRP